MGKNTVEAPDYAPLAQASRESAQIMRGLGEQQLAFAREQYDRSAPILERIANQQINAQNEQMAQARDYYNYMRDTYRPVERGLVQDAQRFNTEAYRNQLASQAAADAGRAFGIAQQQNQRAMGAMGVNPNSGRFGTSNQAQANALAAQRAAAMTGARTQAEQMAYARRLDAAGLGRGLAGASTAAYGGATGAGSQAGANAQSAGMNYMAGMGQGASTIGSGLNMQMTGLSNILNNQTSAFVNSNDSFLGDLGGFLGGAAAAKTAFFPSDRRLKENISFFAVDPQTALNLYEFNYINDDRKFIGVMADEVEREYPDAVKVTDLGFKAVDYDMLGIEFKELV
jgi:hypothetical protein